MSEQEQDQDQEVLSLGRGIKHVPLAKSKKDAVGYPVPMDDGLRAILGDDYEKVEEARRQAQANMILGKTPEYAIQHREGRGGSMYPYIEHQWVTQQLNLIFGWKWSFRVLREQIGNGMVWAYGELTACVGGEWITKAGYGGSDIKKYTKGPNAGKTIDISDDLKAAHAEAKKKAASEFGIAADVYWKKEKVELAFDQDAQATAEEDVF